MDTYVLLGNLIVLVLQRCSSYGMFVLRGFTVFSVEHFLKNFAGVNFCESLILKISRELMFANQYFWGAKKEFNFAALAKNREIRVIFFPRTFPS